MSDRQKSAQCVAEKNTPPQHFHHWLTASFRASGAVHLIGNLPDSPAEAKSRASPKSHTLATISSDRRTFLAARSRWTTFCASRWAIPAQLSLKPWTYHHKTRIWTLQSPNQPMTPYVKWMDLHEKWAIDSRSINQSIDQKDIHYCSIKSINQAKTLIEPY